MTTSTPKDIIASAEACYVKCEQMDSYGIIETISLALLEERARHQWQTIDTAPRDGSLILAYGFPAGEMSGPYDEVGIWPARWAGGRTDFKGYDWDIPDTDYAAMWISPTHWMALPSPPKPSSEPTP